MASYLISLIGGPQIFRVQLVNVTYQFVIAWRDIVEGGWVLDINTVSGEPILTGTSLVPGADLLSPYKHLNIGGSLYVYTPGDPYKIPGYNDLGSSTNLLFVTED